MGIRGKRLLSLVYFRAMYDERRIVDTKLSTLQDIIYEQNQKKYLDIQTNIFIR